MNKIRDTVNIGEQIKYYRKLRNMSQETLALSANTTPAFIGQIERGVKNPTIKTVEKIATALDMELYELLVPLDSGDAPDSSQSREIEKLLFSLKGLNDTELKRIVSIFIEIINIRNLPH